MSKELTIIDKDYIRWVEDLSVRYRQSQIKAAVRVNRELLKYYWELGRDIEEMRVDGRPMPNSSSLRTRLASV